MTKIIFSILVLLSFVTPMGIAHEGHGTPGSMPPPEHSGGKLGDATNKGKAELVFEAWRENEELRLEPKSAKSANEWEKIAVAEITGLSVEIQPPKGGKRKVEAKPKGEFVAVEAKGIDLKKPLTVFITATYKGEKKSAKIPMGKQ